MYYQTPRLRMVVSNIPFIFYSVSIESWTFCPPIFKLLTFLTRFTFCIVPSHITCISNNIKIIIMNKRFSHISPEIDLLLQFYWFGTLCGQVSTSISIKGLGVSQGSGVALFSIIFFYSWQFLGPGAGWPSYWIIFKVR